MFVRSLLGLMLVVSLTGCATTQNPTAVNQLQIRVAQIEGRLDTQVEDVNDLKYAVETLATRVERTAASARPVQKPMSQTVEASSGSSGSGQQDILRVPVSAQDVQKALKAAGYYDGAIDGKLGPGSQRAIKAFQKDHNLQSDGIVGRMTWAALKGYLQ